MIIYFRGCVVREKLKYISDATEKILKQAGVDFTVLTTKHAVDPFYSELDLGMMHTKS